MLGVLFLSNLSLLQHNLVPRTLCSNNKISKKKCHSTYLITNANINLNSISGKGADFTHETVIQLSQLKVPTFPHSPQNQKHIFTSQTCNFLAEPEFMTLQGTYISVTLTRQIQHWFLPIAHAQRACSSLPSSASVNLSKKKYVCASFGFLNVVHTIDQSLQ